MDELNQSEYRICIDEDDMAVKFELHHISSNNPFPLDKVKEEIMKYWLKNNKNQLYYTENVQDTGHFTTTNMFILGTVYDVIDSFQKNNESGDQSPLNKVHQVEQTPLESSNMSTVNTNSFSSDTVKEETYQKFRNFNKIGQTSVESCNMFTENTNLFSSDTVQEETYQNIIDNSQFYHETNSFPSTNFSVLDDIIMEEFDDIPFNNFSSFNKCMEEIKMYLHTNDNKQLYHTDMSIVSNDKSNNIAFDTLNVHADNSTDYNPTKDKTDRVHNTIFGTVNGEINNYPNNDTIYQSSHTELSTTSSDKNVHNNPNECIFCAKIYSSIGDLKTHAVIHIELNKYSCNKCQQTFRLKQELNQHMVNHTGKILVKCDICQKMFGKNKYLNEHKITHSNKKLFKCRSCQKTFSLYKYLRQHIVHVHEKKFKCNIFQKLFARKTALTEHTFLHTGKKQYQCYFCPKMFASLGKYKNHFFSHTGEQIE